jgi:hypothetical protein
MTWWRITYEVYSRPTRVLTTHLVAHDEESARKLMSKKIKENHKIITIERWV